MLCRRFRRFRNNDYEVKDKERPGALKMFEDKEFEALLHEDSCQMQVELQNH